jgi:hypothetical protein
LTGRRAFQAIDGDHDNEQARLTLFADRARALVRGSGDILADMGHNPDLDT